MKPLFLVVFALVTFPHISSSQPNLAFDTVIKGLTQPVDMEEVNDGSGRLFIVERGGRIKIWNGTSVLTTPFLDVSSLITTGGSEQGLLSIAFHPDYPNNGYFFIYYTNTSGYVTLARYSRSSLNVADPTSARILMTIPKKYVNHNGGNLVFGKDGYLYFGTGDGGSAGDPDNNAQNGGSLLGKMLRIDVNNTNPPYYSIPPSNPYASSTTVQKEIIAMGLRNPWRWSFDKQTGDMWIADVGQDAWEEVSMVPANNILDRNYGWPCFEGTHPYKTCSSTAGMITPVFDYGHDASGGASVAGGYVYRGTEFPALQGYYVFKDTYSGNGWITKSDGNGGWQTTRQTGWPSTIVSFSEIGNGTLYAISLSGNIFKIRVSSTLPVHLVTFIGKETGNAFQLTWQVQNEEAGDKYVVETRQETSLTYTAAYSTIATTANDNNTYSAKLLLPTGTVYYRLKIVRANGAVSYSQTLSSNVAAKQSVKAYVAGSDLKLTLPAGTSYVQVIDPIGKVLFGEKTNSATTMVPLRTAAKGVITVRALVKNEWQAVKVVY